MFVTTGMLKFLRNEDELAFVLAHEVAHIELDHGLNAIKQNEGCKSLPRPPRTQMVMVYSLHFVILPKMDLARVLKVRPTFAGLRLRQVSVMTSPKVLR